MDRCTRKSKGPGALTWGLTLGLTGIVGLSALTTAGTQVDRLLDEVGDTLSGVSPGSWMTAPPVPAYTPPPLFIEGEVVVPPLAAPSPEVSGFVETARDRYSTFGMDVDTGSYTLTRNYLRGRHLPPGSAVRVEEFVNYLDYRDAPPGSGNFAVHLEGGRSPYASDRRLLRVGIKAREVEENDRRPVDLTFVVDVSGSMRGPQRLGMVKSSLRHLLGELRDDDRVALVTYGSRARLVFGPTPVSHRETMVRRIQGLGTEGATNVAAGLEFGYRVAAGMLDPARINRVLLCSDGVANIGPRGPEEVLARVRREAERGVLLTTVGFGMGNYSDHLMEQLADRGNGAYAYVDTLREARRIFGADLTSTLETVALDARIQVEFRPEVVLSYRLLGYENREIADEDFRDDTVDAGEVGAGQAVTALYELELAEEPRGPLGVVRVRHLDPRTGPEGLEDSAVIPAGITETATPAWGLRLASAAARFAEVLRGSPWAESVELGELAREVRDLRRERPAVDGLEELAGMIADAAALPPRGPAVCATGR